MAKFGNEATEKAAAHFGIDAPPPQFVRDLQSIPNPTMRIWVADYDGKPSIFLGVGTDGATEPDSLCILSGEVAIKKALDLLIAAVAILNEADFAAAEAQAMKEAKPVTKIP